MRVRVNFRVNAETGEVEVFLIEDISTEEEPERDAVHDQIAQEVGQIVVRRPAPREVVGGVGSPPASISEREDEHDHAPGETYSQEQRSGIEDWDR